MRPKERLLVSKLLNAAYDVFSNHSCNDIDEDTYDGWSEEEKQILLEKYVEWDGNKDITDISYIGIPSLMAFFANLLKKESE